MDFIDFLLEYYVWVLVVLIVLIVTIIGFLADKRMKLKKDKETKNNVTSQNENTASLAENQMVTPPVEPMALEPTPINIENNVGNNVNLNTGFVSDNNLNANNNFGYVPLSEQKPNIPPSPIAFENTTLGNEVGINNQMPLPDLNQGLNVTPEVTPSVAPTVVQPEVTSNSWGMSQPVVEPQITSVMPEVTPSVAPTTVQPEIPSNSWGMSQPVVEPQITPVMPEVTPSVAPMPVQSEPVTNIVNQSVNFGSVPNGTSDNSDVSNMFITGNNQ